MEIVSFFGADRVITFMLLFARLSGLMVFFPFFGHSQIPISAKTALTFFLTIFLFPMASVKSGEIYYLAVEILSELM
ncbi:flagellar biosynthetic protein FliR, partial [Campylobacter sp. MOP51]